MCSSTENSPHPHAICKWNFFFLNSKNFLVSCSLKQMRTISLRLVAIWSQQPPIVHCLHHCSNKTCSIICTWTLKIFTYLGFCPSSVEAGNVFRFSLRHLWCVNWWLLTRKNSKVLRLSCTDLSTFAGRLIKPAK